MGPRGDRRGAARLLTAVVVALQQTYAFPLPACPTMQKIDDAVLLSLGGLRGGSFLFMRMVRHRPVRLAVEEGQGLFPVIPTARAAPRAR